jgi:hypothetical protein
MTAPSAMMASRLVAHPPGARRRGDLPRARHAHHLGERALELAAVPRDGVEGPVDEAIDDEVVEAARDDANRAPSGR